jgi:hypothetical protein
MPRNSLSCGTRVIMEIDPKDPAAASDFLAGVLQAAEFDETFIPIHILIVALHNAIGCSAADSKTSLSHALVITSKSSDLVILTHLHSLLRDVCICRTPEDPTGIVAKITRDRNHLRQKSQATNLPVTGIADNRAVLHLRPDSFKLYLVM